MSDEPTCGLHHDGGDIFVIVDGVKIAKRTALATAYAGIWTMLEPGWIVRDAHRGTGVEIRYEDAPIH
jgi:hypothetical protein